MIKFLQLLTIDRPILSFLFANACSSILLLIILFIFDFLVICISYFFSAYTVSMLNLDIISLLLIFLEFRFFLLISYSELVLKFKQDNWSYKFLLSLKKNVKFKTIFLLFLFFIFSIFMFCFRLNEEYIKEYFILGSLLLSYIVLFLYWTIRDKFVKFIEVVKRKQIFENVSSFVSKSKQVVYSLFNKYQVFLFFLINVLCSSFIFIYLISKFYNYEYNFCATTSRLKDDYLADLLFLNYLYQLIRYILIFKVFDIYSKMESGLIVDFIKKLKTSSKCRKVTSIVLFSIDTLFILFLSRGTSCNHCYIYWIMSYFFGLMSMYVVMFYYWHLENKHKDVLAEVE